MFVSFATVWVIGFGSILSGLPSISVSTNTGGLIIPDIFSKQISVSPERCGPATTTFPPTAKMVYISVTSVDPKSAKNWPLTASVAKFPPLSLSRTGILAGNVTPGRPFTFVIVLFVPVTISVPMFVYAGAT